MPIYGEMSQRWSWTGTELPSARRRALLQANTRALVFQIILSGADTSPESGGCVAVVCVVAGGIESGRFSALSLPCLQRERQQIFLTRKLHTALRKGLTI